MQLDAEDDNREDFHRPTAPPTAAEDPIRPAAEGQSAAG
jgi:hypothetical protein